jgi:hypothetical protein
MKNSDDEIEKCWVCYWKVSRLKIKKIDNYIENNEVISEKYWVCKLKILILKLKNKVNEIEK